uniref:HTH CENPB-type domain-containing protein n=1 Tax=Trichogramma kaykai TaxID=54128 RepID=A0ABD2X145_9HYME
MQYFQAYIFILCIISVISFYIFLQTEKNTQIANAKNDSIKRKFKKFKQTTAHTQSRKPLDDAINEKSSEISIETLQEIHTGDPLWIEDKVFKRIPLSTASIREEALLLYAYVVEKYGSSAQEAFNASRGWFDQFRGRFSLHNVKFTGESASADHAAAIEFPVFFKNLIAEKGYSPHQVFNCDETGLYWKKMPNRTYLSKEEKTAPGGKVSKDRYTLLLCANAAGTFRCKPMLVWKKLWPEIVRESHEPIQQIIQGLFANAHSIRGEGFFDVQESEIVQLISPETEELTPQEIEGSMEAAKQKDDVDESKEPESLSVQSVCKIISLVQEAAGLALAQDPIMARSLQFHRGCEELLKAYEEVRKDFVRRMNKSKDYTSIRSPAHNEDAPQTSKCSNQSGHMMSKPSSILNTNVQLKEKSRGTLNSSTHDNSAPHMPEISNSSNPMTSKQSSILDSNVQLKEKRNPCGTLNSSTHDNSAPHMLGNVDFDLQQLHEDEYEMDHNNSRDNNSDLSVPSIESNLEEFSGISSENSVSENRIENLIF